MDGDSFESFGIDESSIENKSEYDSEDELEEPANLKAQIDQLTNAHAKNAKLIAENAELKTQIQTLVQKAKRTAIEMKKLKDKINSLAGGEAQSRSLSGDSGGGSGGSGGSEGSGGGKVGNLRI